MKNVQDIVNMGRCIGCAACISVCRNGGIRFVEDGGLGFPVADATSDLCESCGACLRACPSADEFQDDE